MVALSPDTIKRDKNFVHNFVVNVLDGGFFGLGMGFGSFVTILPLFISTMTDSAILIGLIPAIHVVGWQLPQLFTARHVARQIRYKPMVLFRTIQERVPFFGLAVIAWFLPEIGPRIALGLSFAMLVWQGFAGGFTATAWQSMVGKIIPGSRWGFFYGVQSAASSLLASFSAILAGILLEKLDSPWDYSICFLLTSVAMAISWFFLSQTREDDGPVPPIPDKQENYWQSIGRILRKDHNFGWFIVVRMLSQLATMGFAFYTVYAVRYFGVGEGLAGIFTAILTIIQTVFNPLMGWLGDRWSHRSVMLLGLSAAVASTVLASRLPGEGWFFVIFALAGIANVAVWTITLAMTLEFGSVSERPAYIGLANTLIAPTAFLIPLFGGWLADIKGYPAAFIASTIGGVLTIIVLLFFFKDQKMKTNGTIPEQ